MTSCKYHSFTVIQSDKDRQVERCKQCGYTKSYNKVNDRVNNVEYLKDHVKDFAQPTGPTANVFEEVYGKSKS